MTKEILTIKLKNGSTEAKPLVRCMATILSGLMDKNPLAVYELVEKCRDSSHKCWGDTEEVLKDCALLQSDGHVHNSIRNIVLSAVEGEGKNFTIGNPVAEED